tara:strand:- start:224 stop:460 length:237 start_codon:yes stop_codon:yes gene_type:complete
MKVFIDGNEVTVNNDVKIIWDDSPIDLGPDGEGHAHVTATYEGLIIEVFDEAGEVYVTSWREQNDLLELADNGLTSTE